MVDVRKVKLPIGIEDFCEIRTEGFYYIDKTGLIRDLLRSWSKVNLFTRPRRFGKSLNMSMLKNFFEIGGRKDIFDGLAISKEQELCEEYMGRFPVISISLKGVSGNDFKTARAMLGAIIGKEAMRFQFLLTSDRLSERERSMYGQLIKVGERNEDPFVMSDAVLMGSLQTLSVLLEKHYGQKTVLLIDEYDVPLAKAFDQGYYDQMVLLIRNLFEQALKTNSSLSFAVMTGCMRISKESIFTGMNNLRVLSIADVEFHEYFGFTDREVRELIEYYNLSGSYDIMKDWYDGYQFGGMDVYCPWDVICYCSKLRADKAAQPENYWSNTSSNDVVRRFIQKADVGTTKKEIEKLVAGEVITKPIHQELTYRDMYHSIENIWSVLFTTGYLTQRGKTEGNQFRLAIPNMEIRTIFTEQIMEYFKENVRQDGEALNELCHALETGDAKSAERQLNVYLRKTISIRDTFVRKRLKENFYHGILLGLLSFKASWSVFSNRESGDGYSDILVEIAEEDMGIIIEVKYSDDGDLESACQKALEQVKKNQYEEELYDDGIEKILKYGIAFYKKRCMVMLADH